MYIKDGIAYADDATPLLKVVALQPMGNYTLLLWFNNEEARMFDFAQMLSSPAFAPLKDQAVFRSVVLDHGVLTWNNGEIDIAPEYLFEHGQAISQDDAYCIKLFDDYMNDPTHEGEETYSLEKCANAWGIKEWVDDKE